MAKRKLPAPPSARKTEPTKKAPPTRTTINKLMPSVQMKPRMAHKPMPARVPAGMAGAVKGSSKAKGMKSPSSKGTGEFGREYRARVAKAGPAKKGGGVDLGKFASEVSQNYAKGAAAVGGALDKMIGSRKRSGTVPGAMKNAPANRAALKKALGK